MKKIITIPFTVFSIILVVLSINAQEKKIDVQEIASLEKKANDVLRLSSYRVKMTSKSYRNVNDTQPYWFINSTSLITKDNFQNIRETKTADGITRTEEIRVGKRKFTRKNNEPWLEIVESASKAFGGSGSGFVTGEPLKNEESIECKYLGKQPINNQSADLYEKKTTRKYKLKNGELNSIYVEKFWIGKDGVFLKTESESINNGKVTSHTIFEYDYDPNIKIEAPIK